MNKITPPPLVSVIIPIYNSATTLNKTLSSIYQQSYKNLQIILVNDGSTDDSLDICREYLKKDKRAKLITQINLGVAAARQAGISNADGTYIIHSDSDDTVLPNAIESLVSIATKNKADITIGSYIIKYPNQSKEITTPQIKTSQELLEGLLTGKYHSSLSNKLIHRSCYAGVCFNPNLNLMEDKLLLIKILTARNYKIASTPKPVFIYNQHPASFTNKTPESALYSTEIVTEEICKIIKGKVKEDLIQHTQNQNRLMIILLSEQPTIKFNKEKDLKIITDTNIPLYKKLIILSLAFKIKLPLYIYKALRKAYRNHLWGDKNSIS